MSSDTTSATAVIACILLIALAGGTLLFAERSSGDTSLRSTESNQQNSSTLPPGPMQSKATTACEECHEARIIVQQRLSKAAWTKEVDKMIKWGAVVDPADRDPLIDYLSTNFPPDKPPYVASRTAPTPKKSK